MRLKNVGNFFEGIIWLLTVFLFLSFLVFESYTWGKYAFFAVSGSILLLSAIEYGGKIQIRIGAYQYFLLAFAFFVLCSALWALDSSDPVTMARTLFRVLILSSFLYWHYVRKENVLQLLSAVMWSGYAVAVYTIAFYGMDTILLATAGASTRLNNAYSNINSIGMACALSCVILFWGMLYKKFRWWAAVPALPSLLVIAATQSRKALLFAAGGIFALVILKYSSQKNFRKNCFRVLLALAAVSGAFFAAAQLEYFSGIAERMESLLHMFTGEGRVDSSAVMRGNLISLGIEWWLRYPFLGIGIGNPHILAAQSLNFDAYLHNNFVELLCGGGIVGFVIFYSRYIYLLTSLWRRRSMDGEYFSICAVWLLLMLAMDLAMVSYYSKLRNYYFMIQFINIECMKRKHRESSHGWKEIG